MFAAAQAKKPATQTVKRVLTKAVKVADAAALSEDEMKQVLNVMKDDDNFEKEDRIAKVDELAGKMDAGPEISLSAVSATNHQTSPTIIRSYQVAVKLTRYSA